MSPRDHREHRDRRDHRDPNDPPADPLMAAITGEDPPDELRADPAYRAAVTDVALLRAELHRLGDALGRPPEPLPPPRTRTRRTALFALAASCAAALLGGTIWLSAAPGREGGQGAGGAAMTAEGAIACARLIVEGTVVRVDSLPGALQDRITLDVTRSYKPEKRGGHEVSFVMDVNVDPRLRPGDHTLVLVPRGSVHPSHWSTGEDVARERAWIERALPGAREMTCGWPRDDTRPDV
ncbi:hypothetical protein [Streptomyces luteolus]|uniref:Uncharacterized protein n=1 Tax=Streptomyces luteolus TaxID=3043615 RepID=A0ABT6T1V3_9ACTN|nr:hypothetical protein [Streptomyces sp. B-S-A12]MDI3421837.1 hypothetical protein [Streptomyces sp. B-S-A12]